MSTAVASRLTALVGERERVLSRLLEREQGQLALICHELARRFSRGGTLLAFGTGPAASDAAHVAVEFMHPVIVGKRALPALALSNDPAGESRLERLARPDDIALLLDHGRADARGESFLAAARARGLLSIAFGAGGGPAPRADHVLRVESEDPQVVQEVQETLYHVLWELVHVFFDHPGLLAESCVTCGDVAVAAHVVELGDRSAVIERGGARERVATDLVPDVRIGELLLCHAGVALERLDEHPRGEPPIPAPTPDPTAFLYPFLGRTEHDLDAVLADVRASTISKGRDVSELRRAIDVAAIEASAAALRSALTGGARLLAFGNGGSATDALDVAADALARGWPAIALGNDSATVTAVANDVGYENVFARQLIALARHGDIALAISTSGSSPSIVAGLEQARRQGMVTCALVGHDGGRVAQLDWLDHLFLVDCDYIPRVQEAHATIYHLLLDAIGDRR